MRRFRNNAGMKVVVGEHHTGDLPSYGEAVGVEKIILVGFYRYIFRVKFGGKTDFFHSDPAQNEFIPVFKSTKL